MSDEKTRPDYYYNEGDWEVTYHHCQFYELTEDLTPGDVMTVGRLQSMPDQYAVKVAVHDEDGDFQEWDTKLFDTKEEAEQAASVNESSSDE